MARPPLFIAIGVRNANGMALLDGVYEGLDQLTRWANDDGYDVVRFDDTTGKLTVAAIKARLRPPRLLNRSRIIVYFCGHGLHAPQDQYWVLSAGPTQPNERISVIGFRDTLATYGPGQISMISDACRSPMVVLGQGQSVVDVYPSLAQPVQKDNFFSSQDGAPSFAVPAQNGNPAYCVFTRVLHDALTRPIPDALDVLYSQLGRQIVSSQSLATYLENYVPGAAVTVNNYQAPQCDPGFRPTANDYVEFLPAGGATPPPGPPPTGPGLTGAPPDLPLGFDYTYETIRMTPQFQAAQQYRINRSRSEWREPFINAARANILNTTIPSRPVSRLLIASDTIPTLFLRHGERAPATTTGPIQRNTESYLYGIEPKEGFAAADRSGVAIAQAGELFTPTPLIDGLWCALGFGQKTYAPAESIGGAEVLAWGPEFYGGPTELGAGEALKGLSQGTLTAQETRQLSTSLRYAKHADPMLGIISAYLYNGIGDVENIRRMCYFYKQNNQDVPFDIALLAGVPLRAAGNGAFHIQVPEVKETPPAERAPNAPDFVWRGTPPLSSSVAGVTPVLRAGWQYLHNSEYAIHKACLPLTDYLTDAPVSTFFGDAVGRALVDAFRRL